MTDELDLAASVRAALKDGCAIREVRMFGGIGFMLNGNLVAAASHRGLLLRVGKDRQAEALAQSGARPMVMRGRTMEGYVYVDPPALSKKTVQNGLRMAVAYVQTLPAKAKAKTKTEKRKTKMKMRFGLGVLAYLAPTFALGFVWHLILFRG